MGIHAARTEGRHARDARHRKTVDDGPQPRPQFAIDRERSRFEMDVGVGAGHMQGRDELSMPHLQHHFHQPRNAGGRFEMPDVGLGGAQRAELPFDRVGGERLLQAVDFDGIAQRGTGAVCFDVADVARIHPRLVECFAHHRSLRTRVRHHETVGTATVVHLRRQNDAMHGVAVGNGAIQRLEQDNRGALARNEPGTAFAEASATAVAGKHAQRTQVVIRRGVQIQVDPTDERSLARATAQLFTGLMDRGQRRRTHGVHRHTRPGEIQEERQPVRDRAE